MNTDLKPRSKLQWACFQAKYQFIVLSKYYPVVDDISYQKLRIKFYNFALKFSLDFLIQRNFYVSNNKIIEYDKLFFLRTGVLQAKFNPVISINSNFKFEDLRLCDKL